MEKIHQFRSGLFQQAKILFIIKAKGFIPGYSDPRALYPIVFHRIRILLFCRFFTAFLLLVWEVLSILSAPSGSASSAICNSFEMSTLSLSFAAVTRIFPCRSSSSPGRHRPRCLLAICKSLFPGNIPALQYQVPLPPEASESHSKLLTYG